MHKSGTSVGDRVVRLRKFFFRFGSSRAKTIPHFHRAWRVLVWCACFGLAATGRTADFTAEATPADSLKVAEGFKVELLYSVPKSQEGSWVALTVDPKGRLIVADQYGKLYRLIPPPLEASTGLKLETIDLPIGQAQGLLYAFDSLYVMVANEAYEGRGLYRVRDTNGDDQFDEVKLLRKLSGGGEHGPHSILLSPDGKGLYIIVGNQTRLTEIDSSRVPLRWSEDHLIPRLWDGNGFMKGVLAPGGWIARIDPEGRAWELISTGYRNPFDAAFNRAGELFTYDADMEWDLNTPWYRPTRINLVTSGSEFGWRSGAGKWPAYYPDNLGSVIDVGPGSPTGVTFGYGAKFPAKYQKALFINDWSFGKLYAVHLIPEGSGYQGEMEEFISGSPLPLTDIVVNSNDGALYFAIGGRKTQSGLYRVTYTGRESTAPAREDTRGARDRALRHRLEKFHGRSDVAAVKEVWPYLDHKDRYVRFAARVALEWQDHPASWRERALTEKNPITAIQALIALVRVTARDEFTRKPDDPAVDPQIRDRVVAALDRIAWKSLSDSQRLDLLRAYALTFIRLGRPDAVTRDRMIAKFDPLFPSPVRELNAELAPMLVYLEAPSASTKLIAALEKAPTQEEQLDYARALRVLRSGWTQAQRETYFHWFLKAAQFRGGASLAGFLRDMKKDAVAGLSETEKLALQPILDATPPSRKNVLEALLAGRQEVKQWKVDELASPVSRGLKNRNFDRGRDLFGAVGCFNCHRFANEGGAVGPDLSAVSGRFSPRDLLESIIDPNKEISDQYAPIRVSTRNGDVFIGRIANMNNEQISLMTDMFDPNGFTSIRRNTIQSIEPSTISPMPEGLLNTLQQDEILDLMAFLLSGGDRRNRMFR